MRQEDFIALEHTLLAIESEYRRGARENDRGRMTRCRRLVIEALEHARWAVRGAKLDAARRAEKEQMIEWMTVWLENPGIFPAWVELRKREQ